MSILSNILGGGVGSAVDAIGGVVDKFVTTDEERAKLQIELEKLKSDGVFNELKLENDDRNSARQREMTVKDRVPATLAYIYTIGFFSILIHILIKGIPAGDIGVISMLLGALTAGQAAILNYYFGSSSSSKVKTDAMVAGLKKVGK